MKFYILIILRKSPVWIFLCRLLPAN